MFYNYDQKHFLNIFKIKTIIFVSKHFWNFSTFWKQEVAPAKVNKLNQQEASNECLNSQDLVRIGF